MFVLECVKHDFSALDRYILSWTVQSTIEKAITEWKVLKLHGIFKVSLEKIKIFVICHVTIHNAFLHSWFIFLKPETGVVGIE